MAQCFISTYRNHYRWHDPEVTPSAKPRDECLSIFPDEDIWISTKTGDNEMDVEDLEKRLHRNELKRWITTYQLGYCKDMVANFIGQPASPSFENQLLEHSKNLYEPESRPKVLPPLPGSRKVYGYIRPARNYTPLTNYQFFYGKTAYHVLKGESKKNPVEEIPEHQEIKKGHKGSTEITCDCRCTKREKNHRELPELALSLS